MQIIQLLTTRTEQHSVLVQLRSHARLVHVARMRQSWPQRRQLVRVADGAKPARVLRHAVGSTDVVVVNFPTIRYDHANPDKYRLPLDTDELPVPLGPEWVGW